MVLNWRIIGIELELIHINYMVTTYLLYGKELSSSGSYLKLWVKKRLKISFDGKKKLENFDVLGHVNKFCRLKISNYL